MRDDWRQTPVSPRLGTAVVIAFLLLIVAMAISDSKPAERTSPPTAVSSMPARQLGSGDRHAHLRTLLAGLSPLFTRYDEVGPASVNLYLEPTVWNELSQDQQAQLMDELASKQIVRDIGATLHLYVSSSEVGTIGPGWTGQWSFRRRER